MRLKHILLYIALMPIHLYKKLSPFLPNSCRYHPSCSTYGLESIRIHGVIKGSIQTLYRILRCNPWGGYGLDPVKLHNTHWLLDFHTHEQGVIRAKSLPFGDDYHQVVTIQSLDLMELPIPLFRENGRGLFTIGFHPMNPHHATLAQAYLENPKAILEKVLATINERYHQPLQKQKATLTLVGIGECGWDSRSNLTQEEQNALMELQIAISEQLNLMLVLHIVKRWQEAIQFKKRYQPKQTWVVHGFRGNPQLFDQLVQNDFAISLHPKCSDTLIQHAFIQRQEARVFLETDDYQEPIQSIYERVVKLTGLSHTTIRKRCNGYSLALYGKKRLLLC